jgi:choline dehydrogenase
VLVLEAGRQDYLWDLYIHMPAALSFPIGNRFYDWKYQSEPEPEMHGRRIYHARGKVLGGSSSINGMIFQRGNALDYERWGADPGLDQWDYAHCLPYFKRMETCLAGADQWRGGSGPLKLERGPATNPLFGAFFEAAQQAGYELTSDVNGYRQEGFAAFDRTIYRGRRLSAARAYLHPAMKRPNLDVRCRAFVSKVLFEGTRAVGVEYSTGGIRSGDQLTAAAAAVGRRQRSGARPARDQARGRRSRRRREPAGPPRGLRAVRLQAARLRRARDEVPQPPEGRVAVAAVPLGPGRYQSLRGRRIRPR